MYRSHPLPVTILLTACMLVAMACGKADASKEVDAPAAKTVAKAEAPKEATQAPADDKKGSDETAESAATDKPAKAAAGSKDLLYPSRLNATAPETFKVKFETTKGNFVASITRAWAPKGVDRFFNLVNAGFFSDIAFFRVIPGFMAQFGIHGDPMVAAKWRSARIKDDPVQSAIASNTKGKLTFAMAGPNTRTTQFFINFGNNVRLDGMGFPPIGEITEGMNVVDSIYGGYGEGAPRGRGPAQGRLQTEGNRYLKSDFPKLDYIKSAAVIP